MGILGGRRRHDRHHCRCFSIDAGMLRMLKKKLAGLGFKPQMFEEDHGQVWGLRLKTSEYEQIHIKAMPDGVIESEAEPPPQYPLAHLDKKYSHSPHRYVGGILRRLRIPFQTARDVPSTCRRPIVARPKNLVDAKTIGLIAAIVLGAFTAGVVYGRRRR